MKPDDNIISRILFHPRAEEPGYVPEGIRTVTTSGNAEIGGYLHLHPTNDALLLFFHGNGEIAADYDDIASFFTSCGVSFWSVDYRGYGKSTGLPAYSLMFDDAEALLNDIPAWEKPWDGRSREYWLWAVPRERLCDISGIPSRSEIVRTDSGQPVCRWIEAHLQAERYGFE